MAVSNVNDTNVSTQLLAPDSTRKGFSIWNDSTAVLYVLRGPGTASATNCSFSLAAGDYFESPDAVYAQGEIRGVWASDASGAARLTTW